MLDRLLVVGLGSIGRRHARLARELAPNLRIAAWRHGAGSQPPTGIDTCVTTLVDAVAFNPQLAVIASPASMHLDAAVPLAKAGIHLLVEKPISASASGVEELITACRSSGVKLMTGYNLRFLPSLMRLRQLLAERHGGRVLSVRSEVGQYLPAWRPDTDYRESVSARSELGGGVLLELSHEIDYLRWLFGEVDWVSATTRRQSGLAIDVEDTAHLVMGFSARSGEPPIVATINMDFIRHDSTRTCAIIGEMGTLRWDAIAGTIEFFEAGGSAWDMVFSHPAGRDESYLAEWRHILACIETGATPSISGDDGLAVVRIVDAAKHSSRQGRVVNIGDTAVPNNSATP